MLPHLSGLMQEETSTPRSKSPNMDIYLTTDPISAIIVNHHVLYQDGSFYDGGFVDDKRHGKGKLHLANGSICECEWDNDKIKGKATITFERGNKYKKYTGHLKDNQFHGYGHLIFAKKIEYSGHFKHGEFCGVGTCTIKTTNTSMIFDGEWSHDEPDPESGTVLTTLSKGKGTIDFLENNNLVKKYSGEWIKCKPHGTGSMTWYSPSRPGIYTGEWDFGNRHGQGMQTYIDGELYDGDWVHDMRHGKGMSKIHMKETTYDGDWVMNDQTGTAKITNTNGEYEGEVLNGQFNGHGMMIYKDGTRYIGSWKNGEYHGLGTLSYCNGDKWDGLWHGNNSGKGKIINNNRIQFIGEWHEGVKTGIVYITDPFNGATFRFDTQGNALQDATKIASLEDKVHILTEMLDEIQEKQE